MIAPIEIYIGTQGILQGTYETLAECARQRFDGSLRGRLTVTGELVGTPLPAAPICHLQCGQST